MPVQHGRLHRWLRPPRHLLWLLAVLTAGSAAAFGWLGWEMLRQDQAVEAQRRGERLDLAAGQAVQTFTRWLSEIPSCAPRGPSGHPAGLPRPLEPAVSLRIGTRRLARKVLPGQ